MMTVSLRYECVTCSAHQPLRMHTATTSHRSSRLGSAIEDLAPCLDTQSCQVDSHSTDQDRADVASDPGGETYPDLDSPGSPCTMLCPLPSEMEEDFNLDPVSIHFRLASSSTSRSATPGFIPCTGNTFGVICPRLSFGYLSFWLCRYRANWKNVGIRAAH